MTDQTTTLSDYKAMADTFLKDRDWYQFHSPKIDSMGLVVEAGELLELFLFCQPTDGGQRILQEKRESVEDELIDIFFWILCFATTSSLDLAQAVKTRWASTFLSDDTNTTVTDLRKLISVHSTPEEAAMSLSYKAAALMNLFLEQSDPLRTKRPAVELLFADVVGALVTFINSASIDVSTAFTRKMEKNAKKYPIEKSKGKSTKYTDL